MIILVYWLFPSVCCALRLPLYRSTLMQLLLLSLIDKTKTLAIIYTSWGQLPNKNLCSLNHTVVYVFALHVFHNVIWYTLCLRNVDYMCVEHVLNTSVLIIFTYTMIHIRTSSQNHHLHGVNLYVFHRELVEMYQTIPFLHTSSNNSTKLVWIYAFHHALTDFFEIPSFM